MRDPYAIYARHVLKLDPLDPIDADPGGAERGQIIHAVLDEFVRACPPELPEDADALLLAIGRRHFARQAHRPQVGAIWWPRFERVAAWFLEVEKRRRAQVERILTETRGGLQMPCPGGPFRIRARADRIEVGRDGALAILDYKTGSLPANSDVQRGLSPQLLIEALIAQGGGFAGIPADSEVDSILYLHLKGGEAEPGKEHDPVGTADLRALLAAARRGIQVLLAHFDDPATAYVPVPRPEIAPVFSDYEHLSRLGEWWGAEADA